MTGFNKDDGILLFIWSLKDQGIEEGIKLGAR
jgi:hypothetical protein